MVLRSASSFICATISTSPLAASVATQVTRPDASNLGWNASPSSRSSLADVDKPKPWDIRRGAGLPPSHQGQETRLLRGVVAEHACEAAGERRGAMLGNAAHRHAGMLRLDQYGNAARLQDFVDDGGDLRGQVLLGLQPARKNVGQSRE